MELNKIFAAVLVAGIVAMLSGFVAKLFVHPAELEKEAYPIEAAADAGAGGPAAPQGPEPLLELIAGADPARGQQVAKVCAQCHQFEKGGPNGLGPNLWGVVGHDIGSHAGFAYSDDIAKHEGSWTYDQLNHFLWKPKAFAPGTKMNFIGIKKPEDRAAVIAWLRTLSDSPVPLPAQSEIDAEKAAAAPPAAAAPAAETPAEEAPAESAPPEPAPH